MTVPKAISLLALILCEGCRCAPEPPAEQEPDEPKPSVPRCTLEAAQFTLPGLSPGERFEEGRDAPFGIEIGRAISHGPEHLVPFVRGGAPHGSAGVLRLKSDLQARIVELGQVVGDVPPPKLSSGADKVFVALTENDANGGGYRLGVIEEESVRWFGTVDQLGDDSPSFSLLVSGASGLLAWDDWDRAAGHSVVSMARFGAADADGVSQLGQTSPSDRDAEQPLLMTRPGGAWLSWIALGKAKVTEQVGDEPLVAPQHAWLEVMPLDDEGRPSGEPLRVTSAQGRVVAYDGLAAHDGSVLFAVRDAETPAELDDGRVRMIRVTPDGTTSVHEVEAPELGASAPNLLYDQNPGGGAPHGWLVVASGAGTTMVAGLSPMGMPLEPATPSGTLGLAGVLAARQGTLLIARPSGRDAVLGLARCGVQEAMPDGGL